MDVAGKIELTAQQRRAAEILATNDLHGLTTEQIAEEVGVAARTVFRWKQDAAFIAYQNEVAERAMESFLADTYNSLRRLVRSGGSDSAKLKAIELVLKNRGRLTDVQKIEAEIDDKRSQAAIDREVEELKRQLEALELG